MKAEREGKTINERGEGRDGGLKKKGQERRDSHWSTGGFS